MLHQNKNKKQKTQKRVKNKITRHKYTAVRSLTSTFLSFSLMAAKVSSMVTVAGSPWGTKATKIPAKRKTQGKKKIHRKI